MIEKNNHKRKHSQNKTDSAWIQCADYFKVLEHWKKKSFNI